MADHVKRGLFATGTGGNLEVGNKFYPIFVYMQGEGGIQTELLCHGICCDSATGENKPASLPQVCKSATSLQVCHSEVTEMNSSTALS